jgi:N-glycosidase YbiA
MAERIDRFNREHAFLSNFYPLAHPITDAAGIRYPTAEHAFQAAKTLHLEQRRRIAARPTPNEAKRAGRQLALRPGRDEIRVRVMGEILGAKFDQPELGRMLLATGDAELVEANGWGDRFWGVDARTGEGRNVLGHLLMALRDELFEVAKETVDA